MSQTTSVQQLKIKSLRHAQLNNGWWCKGKHHRVADHGKCPHGPSNHGTYLQIWSVPEFPILQRGECQAGVLSSSGEVYAGNCHYRFNCTFLMLQKIVPDALHDLF